MPAGNMNSWITRGRGFLLPVLFCFVSVAHAERLPIKTYTVADGLAHNEVNKIVRDSRGFLWFCTAEGCHDLTVIRLQTSALSRACRMPTSPIFSRRAAANIG